MNDRLIPTVILATGLVIAALVFGVLFKEARGSRHTVSVTGSATQGFVSDVVKWRLTLSRQVPDGEQTSGYQQLRADVERLRTQLRAAGIPDTSFSVLPPSSSPMWAREGVRTGYNLQQPVFVISTQPEKLEQLAINPGAFTSTGTSLDMSQLEYFYANIAQLKHSLLGKATEDAHKRAEEIAKSTGSSVGDVVSARAGVFQITEPYSTEVSGMGMYNTSTRRKEITVTVRADFELK